jgi:spore coat polysaccharide biosynthesis protein SpsF
MKNIASLITVRTGSSRLPGKCLLPFGGMNVLEHNIDRAKYFNLNPIVCTTSREEDDVIIEICKKNNVLYFRGPEKNKILRWYQCMKSFELDLIHTIDADDPFFCPNEINKSLNLVCQKSKTPTVIFPSKASMNGAASVGFTFNKSSLEIILKEIADNDDTEMIEPFIDKANTLKKIFLTGSDINHKIHRLTLDYEEDYFFLLCLKAALGTYASRVEINNFISKFPKSKEINESREDDWIKNQNRSNRY